MDKPLIHSDSCLIRVIINEHSKATRKHVQCVGGVDGKRNSKKELSKR